MFVKCKAPPSPHPIGVNPPSDSDRMPVWHVNGGDELMLVTRALTPEGEVATPENSRLSFVLRQTRYCPDPPFWVAEWYDGIEPVTEGGQEGLVKINIPQDIADSLRRGSYHFSMAVSNKFGRGTYTSMEGYMLVEYMPTSPHHDIPYRDDA